MNEKRIAFVDNRDSFVFNISRYFERLGFSVHVFDSHNVSIAEIESFLPDALVISPGPKGPIDAGVSLHCVERFRGVMPILGICLGHQCIGHSYGWTVSRASRPRYGQPAPITHTSTGLFRGIPSPMVGGLYHSLIVRNTKSINDLNVYATSPENEVMAVADPPNAIWGVQFHPESILTEHGEQIVQNFGEMA